MPTPNPKGANPKGASRKKRMESLLHREIATCVQQELRDPRLGFITIVRVELTADLHQVKAFFTVLGDASQRKLASKALEQARGFVQNRYAGVVKTKSLPMLAFAYDDVEERRHGMDDLIRRARLTDSDGGANPEKAAEKPPGAPD
ncbi:MAG: 30S ribosome-binding factor RbfA [Planctomycetes bacterium]|nr:30S ribosome-binding factor RbfA [Planctomycetota bacterium]